MLYIRFAPLESQTWAALLKSRQVAKVATAPHGHTVMSIQKLSREARACMAAFIEHKTEAQKLC